MSSEIVRSENHKRPTIGLLDRIISTKAITCSSAHGAVWNGFTTPRRSVAQNFQPECLNFVPQFDEASEKWRAIVDRCVSCVPCVLAADWMKHTLGVCYRTAGTSK
jgi:hypothetical protein